jgi:5-hydroxyisourate hydrolase-like protein (transthyretin family)
MDPLELPNRVTAGDTFRTVCILRSRFGLVTSGSVELTTNGTRQALLPVGKDGRAAFVIATQKNQPKLSLDFHYVPALEGFVAPPPQTITITLHPPTPWRFTGWVIAGLLVVGWLGWSRRQPPKVQEEHRPTVPQPPRAHIEILGPTSDQNVGWEGLVVDAHEGHPLGSVRIALLQQGFGRSTVLFETHSDGDGAFRIPRSAVQKGTYCELVVETIAYASFATELPPPGQVRLYLVSVRRAILDRLVVWAKRRGVPYRSKSEPTPDWVAEVARQRGNRDLEQWAQAVSTAAFGKEPPLDAQSRELLPPTGPDVGPGPSKSSES